MEDHSLPETEFSPALRPNFSSRFSVCFHTNKILAPEAPASPTPQPLSPLQDNFLFDFRGSFCWGHSTILLTPCKLLQKRKRRPKRRQKRRRRPGLRQRRRRRSASPSLWNWMAARKGRAPARQQGEVTSLCRLATTHSPPPRTAPHHPPAQLCMEYSRRSILRYDLA